MTTSPAGERIPTWDEGIEQLLAKLPRVLGQETGLTINDCRVIHYLVGCRNNAAQAAAAEREACARLVEQALVDGYTAYEISGRIRARKTP